MSPILVVFVSILVASNAQRSPYAGSRPQSGYKDRFVPNNSGGVSSSTLDSIGDRLGESSSTSTGTMRPTGTTGTNGILGSTGTNGATPTRLPFDAYGDQFIVNHWNSLPVDQRPYWLVNQQHIENQRGTPSRPAAGSTFPTTVSAPNNGQDIINRFDGPNPQQSPINNNLNGNSQQEVVYPSNITAEQRLDMEIQFLQDRLNALIERRRQMQPQRGQQQQQQQQQQQPQQQQQRIPQNGRFQRFF